MRYAYDCEVSAHDWLVVFEEVDHEGAWTVIHNNPTMLADFISDEHIYIGFNSKTYDQFIIKGILAGFDFEEVKLLNDFLIDDGNGWDYEPLNQAGYIRFNNADIMLDMQKGLSLKAIEGHLGMDIRETTVPFDLPRPWNQQELEEMIYYCKHDVETTRRIIILRKNYLDTKVDIGRMAGLDEYKSLSMTNAKLTAALLKATPKPHDDERKYVIPKNLKLEYIPKQVLDFFGRIYDPSIPDEKLFKSKLKVMIGDCEATIAYGGIHAAIPHFVWKEKENE